MTAQIYQFLPRSNHKANRAFWKGQTVEELFQAAAAIDVIFPVRPDPLEQMAVEIVNVTFPEMDTAPAEYCAGEKDPA